MVVVSVAAAALFGLIGVGHATIGDPHLAAPSALMVAVLLFMAAEYRRHPTQ